MKVKRTLACLLLFVTAAAVYGCHPPGRDRTVAEPAAVVDFSLETLEGERVVLSELLEGGRNVMLVFWTTRCRHCIIAIPALNEFYLNRRGQVELLSVNVGEHPEIVRRFISSRGPLEYPVLLDEDGTVGRQFNLVGVPTYIVISPEGEELYRGHSLDEARRGAGF